MKKGNNIEYVDERGEIVPLDKCVEVTVKHLNTEIRYFTGKALKAASEAKTYDDLRLVRNLTNTVSRLKDILKHGDDHKLAKVKFKARKISKREREERKRKAA